MTEPSVQVINESAIVILSNHLSQEKIQKAIPQNNLPFYPAGKPAVEFEKRNGERILLEPSKLQPHYDLILFSPAKDPIPCKFSELPAVYARYFELPVPENARVKTRPKAKSKKNIQRAVSGSGKDTVKVAASPAKKNRVIVSVLDTNLNSLNPRDIPAVEWVTHRVDARRILFATFENDLITPKNHDRYFTNGITLELQTPQVKRFFPDFSLFPFREDAFVQYSFRLVQNMYTPSDTRTEPTLKNDRPYSSYLYLGFRKKTNSLERRLRLTNDFGAGVIGQYSPGAYFQEVVHKLFPTNDPPKGWETQIKTDFLVNYGFALEKGIVSERRFLFTGLAQVQLGTLYSDIGAGFRFQTGEFEPYFGFQAKSVLSKWQAYFFLNGLVNWVGYDATLQGGVFNKKNIFVLKPDEIERIVYKSELGLHFSYAGYGFEFSNTLLSPEYKGGMWHNWGRITAIVPF